MLEVDGVDLVREGKLLLENVSLKVAAGEHWALLGPNGAGKTTLLGLCGALTHPTRGTVRVLGHQLGRVDLRELRGYIGHVNPRHRVPSPLTVREVVLTGVTGTNDRMPRWEPTAHERDRADELIDALHITKIADERWPTLSQGERGRTLIARALMPAPRLLLLDEPATGLDVAARERLLAAVSALAAASPDLASVTVTHHLEELPTSTTHAALLRDGRVFTAGPADQVLTTANVSWCFDYQLTITRVRNRWTARTT